jgi:hypothetical protein
MDPDSEKPNQCGFEKLITAPKHLSTIDRYRFALLPLCTFEIILRTFLLESVEVWLARGSSASSSRNSLEKRSRSVSLLMIMKNKITGRKNINCPLVGLNKAKKEELKFQAVHQLAKRLVHTRIRITFCCYQQVNHD